MKSAHDLHIWQLVDGMDIGTVHVILDHDADVRPIFSQIKVSFPLKLSFKYFVYTL